MVDLEPRGKKSTPGGGRKGPREREVCSAFQPSLPVDIHQSVDINNYGRKRDPGEPMPHNPCIPAQRRRRCRAGKLKHVRGGDKQEKEWSWSHGRHADRLFSSLSITNRKCHIIQCQYTAVGFIVFVGNGIMSTTKGDRVKKQKPNDRRKEAVYAAHRRILVIKLAFFRENILS